MWGKRVTEEHVLLRNFLQCNLLESCIFICYCRWKIKNKRNTIQDFCINIMTRGFCTSLYVVQALAYSSCRFWSPNSLGKPLSIKSPNGSKVKVVSTGAGYWPYGWNFTVTRFHSSDSCEYALLFLGQFTDQFGRDLESFYRISPFIRAGKCHEIHSKLSYNL
jgi:hypothetical protein